MSMTDASRRWRPNHLSELPDEILVAIFNFLDYDDLRDTISVSRLFKGFSEPLLYHTIYVLHGRQATAVANSFTASRRRTRWVRRLLISCKFGAENELSLLPPFIAEMHNLQDLRLETPDCNSKHPEDRVGWTQLQDRYERIFGMSSSIVPTREERLLPNLQSCTLHFVDAETELYSLTHYSMLFLHPTLKSLTISCASTDHPNRLLVPFQNDQSLLKSTRLEYLHLEECDIYSPTLAMLLSFPRALKSLKISEGVRYDGFSDRSSRMHGNVSPPSFTDAIQEYCVDSLEWLSLSLGYRRHGSQTINQFGQHLNLTAFEKLRFLEVDRDTADLLRSRRPCDHQTWRRLPPNLETLRVFSIPLTHRTPFRQLGDLRRIPRLPLDECFIASKAKHGVAKLQNLIFAYEYYGMEAALNFRTTTEDGEVQDLNQVNIFKSILVRECMRLQTVLKKAGVSLRLDMTVLPSGFIPPYLFTEANPETFTLWPTVTT